MTVMIDAASMITNMRKSRYLSMNTLADLAGVPVSTISRIESGAIDPTWTMVQRIMESAGFEINQTITESGSDEPIASIIRRLDQAPEKDRARIIGRFMAVSQLALVARRRGVRRVELSKPLNEVLNDLKAKGQDPVVSSLEGYAGDASERCGFFPVVYINSPRDAEGFSGVNPSTPSVMFLLRTTNNVRAATVRAGDIHVVRREWALLDSLASPGRQPDISMSLINHLTADLTHPRIGDMIP